MDSVEENITVDRLQEATETLGNLGPAFSSISMFDEKHEKSRAQIVLMLSFTNMVVAELALHLAKGSEFHDALRAVVRGDHKVEDPEVVAMFLKEIENMNNPMKKN